MSRPKVSGVCRPGNAPLPRGKAPDANSGRPSGDSLSFFAPAREVVVRPWTGRRDGAGPDQQAAEARVSYWDNTDRILENIDRARSRDMERALSLNDRRARGREMDSEIPDGDATSPERLKRVFAVVEAAYRNAAQSSEIGPLAARFQAIGDISHHAARGDVSVSVHYLDSGRHDDVGVVPFEIGSVHLEEAKKESRTSRPDVNAMRVLRLRLRDGVLAAYRKIEPRLRDALKERADIGHVAAEVTLDLRPAETLE